MKLLLIFSVLLFTLSAFSNVPTLKVKAMVNASDKKTVYLVDILETTNMSVIVKKILSKIKLIDTPQKGERRIFTNKAISQILRTNIKSKSVKFLIPSHVIIHNPVNTLTNKRIKSKLISHWKKVCNICEFKIKSISFPSVPKNLRSNHWRMFMSEQIPLGSFSHAIKVSNNNRIENFWVTGHVDVLKTVPVLKRDLYGGQRLQNQDIAYKTRKITYLKNRTVAEPKQIIGRSLKTTLRAGDIIWLENLQRIKAISRGDYVNVVSTTDGWELNLKAVAKQEGYVGDVIKLQNLTSKKVFSGKVVGDNKVELL